ncbi:hypothetical protein CPB85DRAFT_1456010 [Mucidula mucida]|nr:hypothetical protein CPB85DRAFT_1456010 [Mucidula mucida]
MYVQSSINIQMFEDTVQIHSMASTHETLQALFREGNDHGNDRATYTSWAHRLTPIQRHTGGYSAFQAFKHTFKKLVEESAPLQYGLPQYNAWLSQKHKEHKALSKSCKEYEKWAISRTESRAAELDSLRLARLESVIERLKADGWDEEVQLPSTREALQVHTLVKQPRTLTERSWNTIKPALTEIMSNIRADQLEQKLQRAISERIRIVERLGKTFFATLPETPHHPPASALCVHQPFLDIIKNTPPAEDATSKLEEAFNSETVLAICAEWRDEQEKRLTEMLRSRQGRSTDLSLVVNAFTCVYCGTRRGYKVAVWTGARIKTLGQDVYTKCQGFVRMCGLDPDTATAADMDGADAFFHCEECNTCGDQEMNHHHLGNVLSRVDDAELIALGRAEERAVLERNLAYEPSQRSADRQAFVCVHCGVAETSRAARAEHLHFVHELGVEAKAADHYRRSLKNTDTNELYVVVEQAVHQEGVKSS